MMSKTTGTPSSKRSFPRWELTLSPINLTLRLRKHQFTSVLCDKLKSTTQIQLDNNQPITVAITAVQSNDTRGGTAGRLSDPNPSDVLRHT
ncbi:hypothetical protein ACFX2G_004892 [Malus domestica]